MKQVRIMELRGTYKGGGGPDKTILLSAEKHNKALFFVLVTYLRQPDDHEFQIGKIAAEKRLNYVEVIDRRLIDIRCILELNRLISEHNIEIVHTHDDKTLLYGWLLKLLNRQVVIMYTCHSHSCYKREDFKNQLDYYKYQLREKAQIFLMRRFHKPIITVSEETKKRLTKNGIPSKNIKLIYNSIDIDYWRKDRGKLVLRREFDIPQNGYIVGTVGRITYDKDLQTFYKVAKLVTDYIPCVIFVIVGDGYGSELARSKKMVKQMGLDRIVKFTGHRDNLLDIYASFDLFLMTSITEGLPNTVLEAMAMEVPVISTSVGGVPELVMDGETGFLCKSGDVDDLAEKTIQLIRDNDLRKKFSIAARERIEKKFSFDKRLRMIEEYYLNIKNGKSLAV